MNLDLFPKITVILRGYDYESIREIVKILSESKINCVEIALKDKECKNIISKIIDEFNSKMTIGAGTVLNKENLLDVINLGVKFALSPVMFTDEMIDICKKHNIISVPGAYSPTEIYKSYIQGADIIKVFPADIVTPKFFKGVKAPLGNVKLMAVGGVNQKNAKDYFNNKADFLGIGSGIFSSKDLLNGDYKGLRENIKKLEECLI